MRSFLLVKEKKAIVEEAYEQEKNLKPTARKYNVQPSQIRRWKKKLDEFENEEGLTSAKKKRILSSKTLHKGCARKDENKYDELKLYFENLRNMDRIVTVGMLCLELKRVSMSDAPISSLQKRLYRWLGNESIVQRRVTHVAQNTRHDEDAINNFVQYVNGQITTGRYPASHIVNIDETNIYFDMTGAITLANRGTRTISVRTSGSSSRCTILLGISMSGEKLPPFIVYKGKPNGRIAREWTGTTDFPNSAIYAVQDKAWVDERVFLLWIEKIWKPFSTEKASSYLLMDEFSVHLMLNCVNPIQDCGTEVDFVLGGYTSKLQVFDVGVNKPFKGYVKESYEQFMVNTEGRKASRLDVAKWVKDAWNKVTPETIRNTWTSIGFQSHY